MSTKEPTVTTSPQTLNSRVVQDWLALWNGDMSVATDLLADDLQLHVARFDGVTEDKGAEALLTWIGGTRTVIPDLRFEVELGPFVDGDVVILRWLAAGHYDGGVPGATCPAGTPISFTGTDILRVHDSRIAEYWVNADMHVLLGHLGVLGR